MSEYYVDENQAHNIKCYELFASGPKFEHVGKLIQAFNEKYGAFYNLFAKCFSEKINRGQYKLYITRTFNYHDNLPETQRLSREDLAAFEGFVCGFTAAMKG